MHICERIHPEIDIIDRCFRLFVCLLFFGLSRLISGIFSGNLRGLPYALKVLSYAFWASEGYFTKETEPVQHVMRVTDVSNSLSYELNRWELDMAIVFAFGIGLRILSFILMIMLNRDKQR